MKKFVIIGSALSGNKGAAAMLESSIQNLSEYYDETEFTLFSLYPEEDSKQNGYSNLSILKATPIYLALVINVLALIYKLLPFMRSFIVSRSPHIKALAEADALLDQGGITFNDGREIFLLYNIASILPGLLTNTKVIKCGQALGPFKGSINRTAAKLFLPRMALIIARGEITYENLLELGLENVVLGADYAFSLEITDKEKAEARRVIDFDFFNDSKVVGISPSAVLHKRFQKRERDYPGLMAEFIKTIIKKGYNVVLVPHSVRTGTESTHNNDLPLCKKIYEAVDEQDKCLFVDKEIDSQPLRFIIGQCDLYVSSRFHAMISSLSMSVPTLVIGWSHKYREVLDMFDMSDFAVSYKNLDPKKLDDKFEELENNEEVLRQKFNDYLKGVIEESRRHAEYISEVI